MVGERRDDEVLEDVVDAARPAERSADDRSSADATSGETARDDTAVEEGSERAGTGFWAVVQSVGAGLLGVQSSANRKRDFTHGKPIHFVVGGLIGTLLFMLAVWLLVQYVIATS